MSSRNPSNDPSTNHRAAPAGDDDLKQTSSGEQRPRGQSHDNNKRPSFNEEPNLTCLHYENSSNQTAESRLSYYRSNTTKLLEFLKRSDQDSIDRFIAVVRSGASHDDVFATIEQLPSSAGKYSSTHNGVSR